MAELLHDIQNFLPWDEEDVEGYITEANKKAFSLFGDLLEERKTIDYCLEQLLLIKKDLIKRWREENSES